MFAAPLIGFLNHLLTREPWARERLSGFAGQRVAIEFNTLRLVLFIQPTGLFSSVAPESTASVLVRLPPDTPLRFLQDRASVMAKAEISGTADLSETLAFVFRNLRWDVEAELAGVVGDIPARRISQATQLGLEWQRDAFERLRANAIDYLTEEMPMLVREGDFGDFRGRIAQLAETLQALENRLERVGKHA